MKSVPVEAIERIIDDLQTMANEAEKYARWSKREFDSADLYQEYKASADAYQYAIQRLKELIE